MEVIIVLAMHGDLPKDLPRGGLAEFLRSHAGSAGAAEEDRRDQGIRHADLRAKIQAWPRNSQNDPYYAASQELVGQLREVTGFDVIVGFNEFCAPTVEEAIDQAARKGADKVVVATPMMTSGGSHAEKDIPKAIKRAQERHPQIQMVYAWPFEVTDVARLLAAQVSRFM